MRDTRRNLFILMLVAGLLAASAFVILSTRTIDPGKELPPGCSDTAERATGKPKECPRFPTRLGLDLQGGTELIYEARPTPKVPEVKPENIDDALETIRKRTDSLGVSEPEIQRAGATQISIGLPAVKDADRARKQVGATAQLQFYDWEPNLFTSEGPPISFAEAQKRGEAAAETPLTLFQAVERASKLKPRPEPDDVPPGGPAKDVQDRFRGDPRKVREFYDRQNDTGQDKYYVFLPDKRLLPAGEDEPTPPADLGDENPATQFYGSCRELFDTFREVKQKPPPGGGKPKPAKTTECKQQLDSLTKTGNGPPLGSRVLKVPRGIVVAESESDRKTGKQSNRYFVVEDDSELSGSEITDPKQEFDQQRGNEPVVTNKFTDKGREAFQRVTKRIADRGSDLEALLPPGSPPSAAFQRFGITLDNRVLSTPTIDFTELPEGIDGRTGAQISGIGRIQEAQDLAKNLRIGALPIELKLISQTQVSATLGKQALDQGLLAAGVGLALTLLFLMSFYRALGVVAALTLLIYAVLLFTLVKLIPITLTLPGIAGLILTLGVAADANIVIFERIKEEVRAGRSVPAAISGGYRKALRTIIDANVVTIGVAFILFMLATASVKGFAFTLGVGTIVSLFTAVLATSAILGSLSHTRLLRSRHALGAGKERVRWRFDYSGLSKWFFSMSGLILVAGALAIAGLGINFGIDFESGTRIKAAMTQKPGGPEPSIENVRDTLTPLGYGDSKIQELEDPDLGRQIQISTEQLEPDQVERVETELGRDFQLPPEIERQSIGPTFGAQIARTAIIAIIASLFLISLYIGLRFEFKYAVPVLIALAHDLLITSGVYALTEREVTTSTVAALLTILGYSLYDTIIVFDRIRENVPRMPRATFSQIVNRSMSEVLTRSLVTSFSTLIPITALMLFGGETLKDFGFALLVGVASGTYSSVFIASPVLTHWKEREPIYRRRRQIVMEEHGGVVPAFADAPAEEGEEEELVPSRRPRRAAAAGRGKPRRDGRKAAAPAGRRRLGRAGRADGDEGRAPAPAAKPDGGDGARDKRVKEEAAREKDQVREPEPAETEPTARAGDGAEAKRTTRTGATTSTGGARAPTRRARSTDGGANGEPAGGQGSAGERSAGDRSAGDRPAGTPKRSKQNRRPRKKHGRR